MFLVYSDTIEYWRWFCLACCVTIQKAHLWNGIPSILAHANTKLFPCIWTTKSSMFVLQYSPECFKRGHLESSKYQKTVKVAAILWKLCWISFSRSLCVNTDLKDWNQFLLKDVKPKIYAYFFSFEFMAWKGQVSSDVYRKQGLVT